MIKNKPYKCSDLTGNGPGEVASTCGCTGSCNDDSACAINAIVDSGKVIMKISKSEFRLTSHY